MRKECVRKLLTIEKKSKQLLTCIL